MQERTLHTTTEFRLNVNLHCDFSALFHLFNSILSDLKSFRDKNEKKKN